MIIDSAKLNGPCSCGRSHEMITKEAIIEPDHDQRGRRHRG